MKKIIIFGLVSILLVSCGIRNGENNKTNFGDNKQKIEQTIKEKNKNNIKKVDKENVDLTSEEEKMIEDLLDF